MEPYIEFIGTLQNTGFGLVKVQKADPNFADYMHPEAALPKVSRGGPFNHHWLSESALERCHTDIRTLT